MELQLKVAFQIVQAGQLGMRLLGIFLLPICPNSWFCVASKQGRERDPFNLISWKELLCVFFGGSFPSRFLQI